MVLKCFDQIQAVSYTITLTHPTPSESCATPLMAPYPQRGPSHSLRTSITENSVLM